MKVLLFCYSTFADHYASEPVAVSGSIEVLKTHAAGHEHSRHTGPLTWRSDDTARIHTEVWWAIEEVPVI